MPAVEIPQPDALVREAGGGSGRTVAHALNAARAVVHTQGRNPEVVHSFG